MIDLAGQIVAGLVNRIQTDLPAIVTARNAMADVVADGIEAQAPAQVLDHVPPLEIQTEWPFIGVVRQPSRFEDDTGHSMTGVHTLTVVTFVHEPEQQALVRRLDRLTTCVVDCVIDGRYIPAASGGDRVAWGVQLGQVRWGDALADVPSDNDPPQAWITWSEFDIVCRNDDDD